MLNVPSRVLCVTASQLIPLLVKANVAVFEFLLSAAFVIREWILVLENMPCRNLLVQKLKGSFLLGALWSPGREIADNGC
jgi:hypothetical protein